MRPVLLLVIAGHVPSAGCSGLVAASGIDLRELQTRDEVRRTFGEPVAVGTAGRVAYEEFRTRRKISDKSRSIHYLKDEIRTLGLAEAYFLPRELWFAGRRSLRGQTVRIEYDAAGQVVGAQLDGEYQPDGLLVKQARASEPVADLP